MGDIWLIVRLSLPPMDKADRKVVHELASAFNLKSKSAGNGNNRFPILTRTSRTSVYVERNFNAIEERLSRKFLPRRDVGGKKTGTGVKRVKGGGSFNNASVSYRDGDVVGGSAPELGAENRGRAMLEKMGWSSGTALGALNNKGILQPVSHVVKTTKAGLG
jgi:R3H domain/G-patch domain